MIKHDLKRIRRLHRLINDSTHLADWGKQVKQWWLPRMVAKNEIKFKAKEPSFWERIRNWLKRKLGYASNY